MSQLKRLSLLLVFLLFSTPVLAQTSDTYFPSRFHWETKTAEEVGMNSSDIEAAIKYVKANESSNPRDLNIHLNTRTNEPYNNIIGPVKERGDMTGMIIKDGYLIAEWGEPHRVDMTFSISKSFLSTVVGVAWDKGMIDSIDDRVQKYSPVEHFNSEHNSKITWNHLLRQTSDWEGKLFGKPDWADRPEKELTQEVINRERNEPGSEWKYNDVRVNLLALAALKVWREPLPAVLRDHVMDPIGASNTWRWYGYENSWVNIDGIKMQSVSGGGHWGGGMWLSAYDQAKFGYLFLREGNWDGNQILSDNWIRMARTPTEANNGYGYMNFFLNHDQERLPSAPKNAYVFLGAGINMVYIDQKNDLVIVGRWISDYDAMDGFVKRVIDAIE
ncbi:serine hydrolase [Aliifodinibius salipaludis]|uniref:Serine hydrolase n=1 Tax=Fodinibius salipaludis TaxID=2032627 RepID=A0A2A2G753_9BACT|nr:serine hydrolase [Aliifodinibius salipaludis]PAU93461.1 serine hydrolase [Aliifodinibius salipaludis]